MHTDVTPPTVKELDGVFNSDVIQETFRSALVEGEELNTNFFTADQMAAILAQWGSARGLQINLGYIKRNLSTTEGPRYAKPVVLDGQKGHDLRSIDVWVEHNGRDDGAAHWSGMRA